MLFFTGYHIVKISVLEIFSDCNGFPGGSDGKESACNAGDPGSTPGSGLFLLLLEKRNATHSNILAWEIPWAEQPGGPQSMGLQRIGHNSETNPFSF